MTSCWRMPWSQALFHDRQRLLQVRLGPGKVAHGLQQAAQVVQAPSRVGVRFPERLAPDRQRLFLVRLGPGIVPSSIQIVSKVVGQRG